MRLAHVHWLLLVLLPSLAAPAAGGLARPPAGERPVQAGAAHTPARGSAERQAILDAMRAEMRRHDPRPVVFVVRHLRVHGAWAWLAAGPQSPDGRSRYEPEAALLQRRNGRWSVVERMPAFGEREGTELEEDCRYFARLRSRHPAAPADIFPRVNQTPCRSRPRT